MPDPLSSCLLVCDAVIQEKNGLTTLVRVMDTLFVPAGATAVRFYSYVRLIAQGNDFQQHSLQVRVAQPTTEKEWRVIAIAPPHRFVYGLRTDSPAPGAMSLSTEFIINVTE